MKNVSNKKGWMTGVNHPHVEPPPILLIQETYNGKLHKDIVKLKLRRYPTSSTLDPYKFKMSLFKNVKPEELSLFVRNFNITLAASGALEAGAKIQYLRTIVRGEALRQFDSFSADVEGTENLNVDEIIKGLAQYFLPVNLLSK